MTGASGLTYAGVLLAVFANQLCLPVPSVVFLMAAGALSAQGKMSPIIIVCLGVLGCLVADGIWFLLGRRWGSSVMRLLCRFSADPRKCSRKAHEDFRRYGLPVLCVAKFVPGLDGLLPPLIGAEGVSMAGFVAFDAAGSLLWSCAYVALGYVFSNQLELALHWTTHFGTALGIAIGVPVVLYASWRGLTLARMIRELRLRHITPAMLARKLKSNLKVAVLDLATFEGDSDSESPEAIPGAFSVEPSRLQESPHVTIPDDVQIILYSSSGGDIESARAAMALQRIGVEKVWVLEGGFRAWRDQGFPVSHHVATPDVVAERLGIRLPPLRLARS